MLIHLIRHTTPEIKTGTCYGQADIPVTKNFEAEKEVVLSKLLPKYDALYTSPLVRCSRLAESVEANIRHVDNRIMEYSFGDWELKPWSEIKREESRAWMEDFVNIPSPNGESMQIMQRRVHEFFSELIQLDYENVAVVTHSGVQRLLHAHVLETQLKHMFRLQLDFGAVLELNSDSNTGLLTIKHL